MSKPTVAVVMGSRNDWETMSCAVDMLEQLQVPCRAEVISAHRTPDKLAEFARNARDNGYQVIIAGAGGAAHLPGMMAACTDLPVLGVPIQSKALQGIDSLLSIAQMPKGVAVGTLAIGTSGAANAGLLAAQILALSDDRLAERIQAFRKAQTEDVLKHPDPRKPAK